MTTILRSDSLLTPEAAKIVVSAFRFVMEADDLPLGARSGHLLASVARVLRVDVGTPALADTADVFQELSPSMRRALADALVVAASIEGEVTSARQHAAESIARRLGVRSHWVGLLDALRRRKGFAIKRMLVRRSPDARRIFARVWEEEGVFGIFRAIRFVLGLHRDAALAARFRALNKCPEGSFGRAVIEHFATRSLAFPGEKGGMPERMIHHDLMHVINGYDTDPAGECELAGFYAGFADGDAFTFIVTVIATFHLGLPVSPSVVTPDRGAFDPERVLAAFLRGRRLSVDVMGRWNYWELMPLPILEARAQLGIADDGSTRDEPSR